MSTARSFRNIEKRMIVSQSNTLIQQSSTDINDSRNLTRQSFVLDVYQRKMISLLISHIKPFSDRFEMETISFNDFTKFMGIPKGGKTTELIHESISNLIGMSFAVAVSPKVTRYYHWIAGGCEVDEEKGVVHIQLDPSLKPFLLGNRARFTQYELGFISNFKKKYTCRLYEYLRSYIGIKEAKLTVDNFSIKITDGQYRRAADIKRYVIEPAIEEINASSDIAVSYSEHREPGAAGRMKTVSYEFFIREKSKKEKQKIIESWGITPEEIKRYDEDIRPDFDEEGLNLKNLPFY